jgi:hypothetical protein
MELSFADVSSADAAALAEELELALLNAGAPSSSLSLKPSSTEHMDVGSVLWVGAEAAAHALGAIGYVACFAKCIYEVVKKNDVTLVVLTENGAIKLPASDITLQRIENAIAGTNATKSKKKAKSKSKV